MSKYLEVIKRFGLYSNIPDPEFTTPITKLSVAEKLFELSEKKWNVDTNPPEAPIDEVAEEENHGTE